MKNKVIGVLIFLFFIAVPFLLEGGDMLRFLLPSPILIVFGPAIGLTIAHYRKGTDKQSVLKKAKKYLIISGIIGTLLGFMTVLWTTTPENIANFEIFKKFSVCLVSTIYGIVSAYIIDTFIDEKS